MVRVILIFAVLGVLTTISPVLAEDPEPVAGWVTVRTYAPGTSVIPAWQTVEVPEDGYVLLSFGSELAALWGPSFNPSDLPEPYKSLCNCNAFAMQCRHGNYC